MTIPTSCTVLACRRCRKMVKKSEVFVVKEHIRGETWRCPDCNGVCDAIELRNKPGPKKRKSRAKDT